LSAQDRRFRRLISRGPRGAFALKPLKPGWPGPGVEVAGPGAVTSDVARSFGGRGGTSTADAGGMHEELVEVLIFLAHRARSKLEHACAEEEGCAHEILFLRALLRAGQQQKGRDLARSLGWSEGRVTQVVDALEEKEQVERRRGISITGAGAREAEYGGHLLKQVAEPMLRALEEEERELLSALLRRMRRLLSSSSSEAAAGSIPSTTSQGIR
jgi:DNA-binding MarR family transcriptional regulator